MTSLLVKLKEAQLTRYSNVELVRKMKELNLKEYPYLGTAGRCKAYTIDELYSTSVVMFEYEDKTVLNVSFNNRVLMDYQQIFRGTDSFDKAVSTLYAGFVGMSERAEEYYFKAG